MGLSTVEQETIIRIEKVEKDKIHIYTSDSNMIAKLDKYPAYKMIKEYKNEGQIVAKEYEGSRKLLTLRSKLTERKITDEQRKIMSERLKKMREERKIK